MNQNAVTETFTLTNGVNIPKLGLGTWFIDDNQVVDAVKQAIQLGYRHIDTAQAYGNEAGVGLGVRTSSVSREQLFITSKIAAEHKTYESAKCSIEKSLQTMGLDYLDLMIIHSPQPWTEWRATDKNFDEGNLQAWQALEDAYRAGQLKAIGVSNFQQSDLNNLLDNATIKPMVNQILVHIGNTDHELIKFCQQNSLIVEAYSPIAHGTILQHPMINAMAERYQVSVAQLCIQYVIQLGTVALPKTANPEHMKNNAMLDFVISDTDMDQLKQVQAVDYGEFAKFPVFSGQ